MYYQSNQDRSSSPRCCAFLWNTSLFSSVYNSAPWYGKEKWNFGKSWVWAFHRSRAAAPFCSLNVAPFPPFSVSCQGCCTGRIPGVCLSAGQESSAAFMMFLSRSLPVCIVHLWVFIHFCVCVCMCVFKTGGGGLAWLCGRAHLTEAGEMVVISVDVVIGRSPRCHLRRPELPLQRVCIQAVCVSVWMLYAWSDTWH